MVKEVALLLVLLLLLLSVSDTKTVAGVTQEHLVDDIHTALDLLVSVSEPNTQSTSPDDQRGKRCPTISSVVPPVVNPDLGDNIKTDGV